MEVEPYVGVPSPGFMGAAGDTMGISVSVPTFRGGGASFAKNYVAISFGIDGLMTSLEPDDVVPRYGLTEFKLEHFADHLHMRDFIVSSAETFIRAKNEYIEATPSPISSEGLAKLSRSYRGIILDLAQTLQSSGQEEASTLFTHLDFVWHFCEIMFITSHPELPVLPYLMSWVQQNFDNSDEILSEITPYLPILGGTDSRSTPEDVQRDNLTKLWSIIYLYTFHGRTVDAAALLPYTNVNNSQTYEEQLKLMQELMRKKPVFTPMAHSVSEFESNWNIWHQECESRLNQRVFHGSSQLVFLAKILSGNEEGFNEAKDFINTWHEYLVMMLNYQYPVVRPPLLKGFARKAIDDYGDDGLKLKPIEEVILSAMDYDVVAVLKEMQTHFQHPWFALHFSDLLFYGGMYIGDSNDIAIDYGSIRPIRDDLLQEYGTSLMQHPGLWEVGIRYLETMSDRQGFPIISQLLRRRKPVSEFEAEKLIRIAESLGLPDEAQGMCKELAFEALKEDRVQHALVWSIRSADVALTSSIVDKILLDDKADVLNITPILQTFLPKLHNCGERILFLKGFSEFRNHLNESDYEAAIVVLCQMIHDQLIPKRMAPKVLAYLHRFGDAGFKFRPEEITTLTEYIHLKVGKAYLQQQAATEYEFNEEFRKLNKILLMNRAHSLLTTFRAANKEKEVVGTQAK